MILDPALEASIPPRKMDFAGQLDRVARRLRSMETSARVRIAKEQVRKIRELSRQPRELKRELETLIAAYRPELLAELGCSTITAAILIGQTAGAERFPTDAHLARMAGVAPIPASSGKQERHRLHRGGNRRLNRALHVIAITRGRWDPATKAYLQRKEAEGKSRMEALRCLKRQLARHFHRLLLKPPAAPCHASEHSSPASECSGSHQSRWGSHAAAGAVGFDPRRSRTRRHLNHSLYGLGAAELNVESQELPYEHVRGDDDRREPALLGRQRQAGELSLEEPARPIAVVFPALVGEVADRGDAAVLLGRACAESPFPCAS